MRCFAIIWGPGPLYIRGKLIMASKEGIKWYEWAFCIVIIALLIPMIIFELIRSRLEGGPSR